MTTSLRYARTHTTTAAVVTAGAVWLATNGHWIPAAALAYTALFFGWLGAREYAHHRRIVAEHEWARRCALGEEPPPLDPCCRLARASWGAAHDRRCTDLATRQTDHGSAA